MFVAAKAPFAALALPPGDKIPTAPAAPLAPEPKPRHNIRRRFAKKRKRLVQRPAKSPPSKTVPKDPPNTTGAGAERSEKDTLAAKAAETEIAAKAPAGKHEGRTPWLRRCSSVSSRRRSPPTV